MKALSKGLFLATMITGFFTSGYAMTPTPEMVRLSQCRAFPETTNLTPKQNYIEPRHHRKKRLYATVHSFQSGGIFTFRIIFVAPNGEVFKSQLFDSTNFPATPFRLAKFKPSATGVYAVYYELESVTTLGGALLEIQTQNTWNHSVTLSQIFIDADSATLGQRVLRAAFSFP